MISRSSLALLLTLVCPTFAFAQALEVDAALGNLPVAYVDRPLNLPAKYIRLDGRMDAYRLADETHVDMNVGFALGLTSSIEFGVSSHRLGAIGDGIGNPGPTFFGQGGAVPLSLTPEADDPRFESVALYGRFAAAQASDFNLSIDVGTMIPTQADLPWVMFVGVPIRARLAERFAIDAAAEFSIAFYEDPDGDGTDPFISMHIPIAGVLNIVPQVYIAGRSGIYLPDMDFNAFTIPMTLELGVTVAGERPWFDLVGSFGFPRLLVPGAEDAVDSEYWVASFGINGFIGL